MANWLLRTMAADMSPQQAYRNGRKTWHGGPTVLQGGGVYAAGQLARPYVEIPVSCKAIAIGPASDVGAATVYWSPPGSARYASFRVDSRNPLVMDMPVNPSETWNTNQLFEPPGTGSIKVEPVNTSLPYATPFTPGLELLVYFDLAGIELPRARADGSYQYFKKNGTADQLTTAESLVASFYGGGRRLVHWTFSVTDAVKTITAWRFAGVTYYDTGTQVLQAEHQISPAVGGAANTIPALGTASYVLNGPRYDKYNFYATGSALGAEAFFSYTVSD